MSKPMKSAWESWSSLLVVMSCVSVGAGCGAGDMAEGDDLNTQQQAVAATTPQKCSTVAFEGVYPPPVTGDQTTCSCGAVKTSIGSSVYGTNLYSYESDICGAAAHAGAIPLSGGNVTVTVQSYQSKFTGSTRNGITSQTSTVYTGSFTVAAHK